MRLASRAARIGLGSGTPFAHLPLQVQLRSVCQFTNQELSQEQPDLMMAVATPPLTAPIAVSPQFDLAAFDRHWLEGAKYTR